MIGDIKSALSLKSTDRKRLNSNLRSLAQQAPSIVTNRPWRRQVGMQFHHETRALRNIGDRHTYRVVFSGRARGVELFFRDRHPAQVACASARPNLIERPVLRRFSGAGEDFRFSASASTR